MGYVNQLFSIMTKTPTNEQTPMPLAIEQARRKPIPHTDSYEIDEHGFVFRRGKKLSQTYRSGGWYAKVIDKNGKQWNFNSEKLAKSIFGEEDISLSRHAIEEVIGARPIPDFPRYSITPYGAVYCGEPPRRGARAGQRYLLNESLKRGHPYVTLYHYDGTRRSVRLSKLVDMAWGD